MGWWPEGPFRGKRGAAARAALVSSSPRLPLPAPRQGRVPSCAGDSSPCRRYPGTQLHQHRPGNQLAPVTPAGRRVAGPASGVPAALEAFLSSLPVQPHEGQPRDSPRAWAPCSGTALGWDADLRSCCMKTLHRATCSRRAATEQRGRDALPQGHRGPEPPWAVTL